MIHRDLKERLQLYMHYFLNNDCVVNRKETDPVIEKSLGADVENIQWTYQTPALEVIADISNMCRKKLSLRSKPLPMPLCLEIEKKVHILMITIDTIRLAEYYNQYIYFECRVKPSILVSSQQGLVKAIDEYEKSGSLNDMDRVVWRLEAYFFKKCFEIHYT